MWQCEHQRSECVAAWQNYEQIYGRRSWDNPIETVLRQLQLILPCHHSVQNGWMNWLRTLSTASTVSFHSRSHSQILSTMSISCIKAAEVKISHASVDDQSVWENADVKKEIRNEVSFTATVLLQISITTTGHRRNETKRRGMLLMSAGQQRINNITSALHAPKSTHHRQVHYYSFLTHHE